MLASVTAAVFLAAARLPARPARAEEVQVVSEGKDAGVIDVYRVGSTRYLNAKQAAAVYGGRVYWFPVAGRVQLSVRGKQAQFVLKSPEARVGDKAVRLSNPVLVRTNAVFIPIDFFFSDAFGEISGMSTQFNPQTQLLTVDKRSTVGPLRWFSYKDHTRVVLEYNGGLGYTLSRRGRSALDVAVPFGVLDAPEGAEIADGIVQKVALRQEPKLARLQIQLQADGAAWDTKVFPPAQVGSHHRLVLDVFPSEAALSAARPRGKPFPKPDAAHPSPDEPVVLGEGAPAAAPAPEPAVETARGGAAGPMTPPDVESVPAAPPAAAPGAVAEALPLPKSWRRRRIVVDAGHGGKDSGASGRRGTLEKDINLAAALELARLLREEGAFEVLLTRDSDVFIPLAERSRMANDFSADLFISLHCNSSVRRTEAGFEIYFLSERASDPEAERVAEMENASLALEEGQPQDQDAALLLHAMAKTEYINDASVLAGLMTRSVSNRVNLPDRGVKQAAFYVLRGTNAPAVLVEMGFVSNTSEEAKLESKKFRRKIIEGLYAGILDFGKRQEWRLAGGAAP